MSKLFKNPVSSSLKWSYHHLILGWLWALRSMKYLESYVAHSRCSIKVSRSPQPHPPTPVLYLLVGPESPGAAVAVDVEGGGNSGWLVTLPYCMLSSPFGCPAPSGSSRGTAVWASEVALSFSGTNFMDLSFRGNEDKSVSLFVGVYMPNPHGHWKPLSHSLSHSFIQLTY